MKPPLQNGPGRGGARAGGGAKPAGYVPPAARIDYEEARARLESLKGEHSELELKVKRGEYLPRDAMREANAILLSTLAQTLRSLPDNLERRLHLAPEVASEIEKVIDEALLDMANGLALFTDQ